MTTGVVEHNGTRHSQLEIIIMLHSDYLLLDVSHQKLLDWRVESVLRQGGFQCLAHFPAAVRQLGDSTVDDVTCTKVYLSYKIRAYARNFGLMLNLLIRVKQISNNILALCFLPDYPGVDCLHSDGNTWHDY